LSLPLALDSTGNTTGLKEYKGYGTIPLKSESLPTAEIIFAGEKRDLPTINLYSLTPTAMSFV
jgi:hypothetical protein